MQKTLSIKFVRHIRVCDYNKNLKAGEHPLYDFDVLIDGVRRATFKKNIGRGYDLALQFPEHFEFVKTPKRDGSQLHRVIAAPSKAKFLETVQDCILNGLIPKPEEIERRIAAKKEAAAKIAAEAVAEQAAEELRQRYEEHGPAMLFALEEVATHLPDILRAFETLKIVAREEEKSHLAHEIKACRVYRKLIEDVIPKVKGVK